MKQLKSILAASVLVALTSGSVLVLSTSSAMAANDKARMSDAVRALAEVAGPEFVDVIVTYKAMPGQAEAHRINGLGADINRAYGRLPMRALSIPAHALEALAHNKNIKFISDDGEVESYTEAARLTANEPTGNNFNTGFDGSGIGVAVIDSGIQFHSDQNNTLRQYNFVGDEFNAPTIGNNGNIFPYNDQPLSDSFGHGTHVTGIIAGDGRESAGALNKGLATKAKVLSLQVLDANGRGDVSDLIASLDWLLQYGEYFDIRVVNLSLGKAVESEAALDPLVQAVEAVWDAGIVVVASAGNYGRDGHFTITEYEQPRQLA